jgi:hypothetical protein
MGVSGFVCHVLAQLLSRLAVQLLQHIEKPDARIEEEGGPVAALCLEDVDFPLVRGLDLRENLEAAILAMDVLEVGYIVEEVNMSSV